MDTAVTNVEFVAGGDTDWQQFGSTTGSDQGSDVEEDEPDDEAMVDSLGGARTSGPYGQGKQKSHSDASMSSSRGRPSNIGKLIEAQRATTTAIERGQKAIADAIMNEGIESRKQQEESNATMMRHDAEQRALDRSSNESSIRVLAMALMGQYNPNSSC